MAICENINSTDADGLDRRLEGDCEACVKGRRRRGRPSGSGKRHQEGSKPKTFRHFTPASQTILSHLVLAERFSRSEVEIIEDALVRLARSRSNEIPKLAEYLRRKGL